MPNPSDLDWRPVLLVKVTREPFTGSPCGLQVSRLHLALHPDGVVCAAWDTPAEERVYPYAQLVGWKPLRDVPFVLPVRFARKGDPRVSALIPNVTWILPYDAEQYRLYQRLQSTWGGLISLIDAAPSSSYTLDAVGGLVSPIPYSPNFN